MIRAPLRNSCGVSNFGFEIVVLFEISLELINLYGAFAVGFGVFLQA